MNMTIKQAATALGVSKETVRRYLHALSPEEQARAYYRVQKGGNTVILITEEGQKILHQTATNHLTADASANTTTTTTTTQTDTRTDTESHTTSHVDEAAQAYPVGKSLDKQGKVADLTPDVKEEAPTRGGTFVGTSTQTDRGGTEAAQTDTMTERYIESLQATIELLKAQLAEKDSQLDALLKQNSMTLAAYLKPQLEEKEAPDIEMEDIPTKPKTFWQRLFGL